MKLKYKLITRKGKTIEGLMPIKADMLKGVYSSTNISLRLTLLIDLGKHLIDNHYSYEDLDEYQLLDTELVD